MEEVGVVKKVENVFATVVIERKSACDQCKQGCKITGGGAEIEALNRAGAGVGQKVMVRMKPYTYLKGSLLVYGFPALSLIVGAIIGRELLADHIQVIDKDLLSAITGFSACILSLIFVRIISAKADRKTELKPVIEDILSE